MVVGTWLRSAATSHYSRCGLAEEIVDIMSPRHVIEGFIKDFVQDLHNDSAAIFAGAGLSKGSGFVDWPELLRDIATELGLNVDI